MSIYDNYKISIENENLLYSSNDIIKLFEFSGNSNKSYVKFFSPEYNFLNSNFGFSFNDITNTIIYNSFNNIFNSDVFIKGKIDAYEFPSRVLILDNFNKINPSYLPNLSSGIIYNTNSIGIGTSIPETNFHLKYGDAFIENGRLGIGTKPLYHFHLNKNDTMINHPAFEISSNNNTIINVFTEKKEINIYGNLSTKSLNISNNLIGNNEKIIINNDLYLSNINSFNNKIFINSNIDLIINNNSIKNIISNINNINNCFTIIDKEINFNNNISISSNNNLLFLNNNNNSLIIDRNYIKTDNLILSNINLLNYDSLTSNPYKESIFDIKGKIRNYNDSPNIIKKIYSNSSKLFIITSNKFYIYNLLTKSYSSQSINLENSIFKTKYDNYSYYYNSQLFINDSSPIFIELLDYSLTSNPQIFFYIDNNKQIFKRNINTSIQITGLNENVIKIDTYNYLNIEKFIVLTDTNKLFFYNGFSFIQISLSGIILDFATGESHTIVLTTTGVWSFGSNYNNDKFKKGYSTDLPLNIENDSDLTLVRKIETFNNINIIKVKAFINSSAVIDNNGYVYIFGNINKSLITITYKLIELIDIYDFTFNNTELFLLSYFNDIFTLIENNNSKIIILPNEFYGISIKSRGSILIGGNNFYKQTPRNSLLVENYIGIGSNLSYNPKYSLEINGNINIKNGSIFYNDELFSSSISINPIIDNWNKINNDLYYINGNIGIGLLYPKEKLDINGNTIIQSNLYIKGKIITNDYKPLNINKEKEIYYIGKFGFNTKTPKSTIDIYNGDIKVSYFKYIGNFLEYSNNYEYNIPNISLNTPYFSPIYTNYDGSLFITSFYSILNDDNNNNNNNVIIYKLINNQITSFPITGIENGNTSFGISIALTNNGSSIFIGAPKQKNISSISTIITGGIYRFYFDINNNLIKDTNRIIELIPNTNDYYLIGKNINCSGNGSILISTITNYNHLLYLKDLNKNITTILDFNKYTIYHSTFNPELSLNQYPTNSYNNNDISIDINNNGSIIIINFIFDAIQQTITNFPFFNFYIIKNYQIYFLKFPNNFINSYITSLSLTDDGNRLFITTISGNHFIYDFDFNNLNYETLILNNIEYNYFNIKESYIIYKYSIIQNYRGKITKSGNKLFLNNKEHIIEYIYNFINDNWIISKEPILIPSVNNYNYSFDYNGLLFYINYIEKITDTTTFDNIKTTVNKYKYYNETNSLNLNNSNLFINTDTFIYSNLYSHSFIGNGSNISNLQLTNIYNNIGSNGVIFSSNSLLYISSNFIWNNSNNSLNINGFLNLTSNINVNSNILVLSNISTTFGNIISGSNIIIQSNLRTIKGSIYSTCNIYSSCNIYCDSNIYINSNIYAVNDIITNYNIISYYGNIISGFNIISSNNIITQSNISTRFGNITSASNIIAQSNISTRFGNITSASNIISQSNISTILGNITSASNIFSQSNISTILGNITSASNIIAQSNIIGFSNLEITSNINTLRGSIISSFNLIANSNIIGFSNLEITSNINTLRGSIISSYNIIAQSNISTIFGNINSASNIIAQSNIIGFSNLNITSNINTLRGSIISSSNIIAFSNIYTKFFYGDGCNISNILAENIIGIGMVKNGGTGRSNLNSNSLMVGNGSNSIILTNDLLWLNNRLIFSNNTSLIISNIAPIINIPFISNNHFIEKLNINNGGTGNSNFINNSITFILSNQFLTSSNLYWCNIESNLYINGNIYISSNIFGSGSNIININPRNFISNVPVNYGGTGSNFFNNGSILIGNGTSNILTNQNLNWNNLTNTLNVSNVNILNNLIINGSNASNIDANKLINIISLKNGGIGISNINNGELLFGFDNLKIASSSNIKWNNQNLFLTIQSNLFSSNIFSSNFNGNGFNISNLNINNLNGILPFSKGGFGFNNIYKGNFIYANDNNQLSNLDTINWDNSSLTLKISGNIDIFNNNFYGNGFNISNLNANNIIGIIPVDQGGTGLRNFDKGKILIGNNKDSLIQTDKLTWDEFNSRLGIGTTNPQNTLDVLGEIKCSQLTVGTTVITSSGLTNAIDINTVSAGILKVQYGGTGLNNIQSNKFIIGSNNNFMQQTHNLLWDNNNLGIGSDRTPLKTIDIYGDINLSGNIFKNYELIPSITSFNSSSENSNILFTDKQLFIGYSNNDNYKLKVNGNIYVAGYITGLSDIRYKTNISNILNPIEKIEKLNGVYYNLINNNKRSIGLIAQDVEKILPEVVYTNIDDTKSIAYGNIIAILIESIKELTQRIKKLEEKL